MNPTPDPSTVLPSGATQTNQSNVALSQSTNGGVYTGTQASQQLPPALTNAVSNPSTVNPTTLGAQPFTVPTTPNNTNDFVQSLSAGLPGQGVPSANQLNQNEQQAQGQVDQTTQEINQLLQQLGQKGGDVSSMQQAAGINQLGLNLQDLNTQYAQKKAQYDLAQQKIVGQPLETGYMLGQSGILQANRAVELGAIAAQQQAAQGNLNTAFNTINQTISQKYQPIIDQLAAKQQFYNINKDKLTQAQLKVATKQAAIVEQQKQQALNAYKIEQDASTALSQAVKSGFIDPATGFQAITDLATGKKTPQQISQELGLSLNGIQGSGNLADAISSVESGGSYNAIGKQISSGENKGYSALGKYQIMPNLWFKEIGLNPDSQTDVQKFLSTPSLQDSLFKNIIDKLTTQYGDPSKAVAAYFGGDAAAKAYGTPLGDKISDGNMTVNQYVNSVMKNYGGNVPKAPGVTGSSTIDATKTGYATSPVPNTGGLTQAALDQKALDIAMGDTAAPKGGTGATYLQNKAINNRVAELNAGGNIAANKAQLKADTASLKTQTGQLDSITKSLANADDGFKQVLSTFNGKGLNNSLPVVNFLANKVKYNLGDGDVAALKAGLQEVSTEYAQVLSRGGQLTVADKQKADDILNGNLSMASLQKVLDVVHAQGEINKTNAQKQVDAIQGRINGIIKGASPTSSSAPDITSLRTKYNY